jgi:hypothetical protein
MDRKFSFALRRQWTCREGRRRRVPWFAISPIWCKQLFLWVSMWVTHCPDNDYDLKADDKEYFDGMGALKLINRSPR